MAGLGGGGSLFTGDRRTDAGSWVVSLDAIGLRLVRTFDLEDVDPEARRSGFLPGRRLVGNECDTSRGFVEDVLAVWVGAGILEAISDVCARDPTRLSSQAEMGDFDYFDFDTS